MEPALIGTMTNKPGLETPTHGSFQILNRKAGKFKLMKIACFLQGCGERELVSLVRMRNQERWKHGNGLWVILDGMRRN